jgi:hypothetical protein
MLDTRLALLLDPEAVNPEPAAPAEGPEERG